MNHIFTFLLHQPGWLVLLVTGLIVFAEDALFVGFVVPGETAAVVAGVAAKLDHTPLAGALAVVVAAAIIGDTVGYEVGRHFGARLLRLSIFERHQKRLHDAQAFLARRGGAAVFLGRWTAFFRAVMPALAGTARMPYRRFIVFNATGGFSWGITVVLLGYAAGASYATVAKHFGEGSALVVLFVVIVGLLVWRLLKRHKKES